MTTHKKTTNFEIISKLQTIEQKIDKLTEQIYAQTQSNLESHSNGYYIPIKSLIQNKFYELYEKISQNFNTILHKLLNIQEDQYYIKKEFINTINNIVSQQQSQQKQIDFNVNTISTKINNVCSEIDDLNSELENTIQIL